MKALIPAAELGTRFLPLSRVVPKEMLPIGNKPAMELLVEEARRAGAEEIVVIISHAKALMRKLEVSLPKLANRTNVVRPYVEKTLYGEVNITPVSVLRFEQAIQLDTRRRSVRQSWRWQMRRLRRSCGNEVSFTRD